MAASVTAEPASPAAAYRPMQFALTRTDPIGSRVYFIRPATLDDVDDMDEEVAEGDIVLKHDSLAVVDDVTPEVGQTVLLYNDVGEYAGVHLILKVFDIGANHFLVIESEDFGEVTPSALSPAIRIWLNNYGVKCKVLMYTDPDADPTVRIMSATPDQQGVTYLNVDSVLRNFFNNDFNAFALEVGGGEVVQNAHSVSAYFYKVHIVEVYDEPGVSGVVDPFDGDHDILVDEDDRVVVNAVHPYADWDANSMDAYVVKHEDTPYPRFLTHAPRKLIGSTQYVTLRMGLGDRYRLHMLTSSEEVVSVDPYTCDFTLRILDGSNAFIGSKDIELEPTTAAFSVAVGPADLSPFFTLPDVYTVYIAKGESILSEPVRITVDRVCSEADRPFTVLNLLGGIDSFTFTSRELDFAKDGESNYTASIIGATKDERQWIVTNLLKRGKVETVEKGYSSGTGYDWQRRAYKGALVVTRISETRVAPVIILSTSAQASSTSVVQRPLTIEFSVGVDLISQQG